ncbi:hypothetical protein LY90DRAFT_399529, partial [Neocallimastix californiae]
NSDLEAYSHNLKHGSFAELAFQLNVYVNYENQRFLYTRSLLVGEQSKTLRIQLFDDKKNLHRRINEQRYYGRLAATSQLSM